MRKELKVEHKPNIVNGFKEGVKPLTDRLGENRAVNRVKKENVKEKRELKEDNTKLKENGKERGFLRLSEDASTGLALLGIGGIALFTGVGLIHAGFTSESDALLPLGFIIAGGGLFTAVTGLVSFIVAVIEKEFFD